MRAVSRYIALFVLWISSFSLLAQMYDLDSARIRLTKVYDTKVNVRPESKINTDKWEFSPVFYGDGVVYVGSRKDDKYIDQTNKTPFFTLRYAEVSQDGRLTHPTTFGPRNSPLLHEGPVDFNRSGDLMYYTLSTTSPDSRDVPLQIYTALKGEENWENLGPLDFIKPGYSYVHPTLNAAENELVFAANLDDAYGGMDLYQSKRVNGEWTDPVNLGIQVNTGGNELFPRFHPSGLLFFSSNGIGNGKDLDIYFTYQENGKYVKPIKLRAPFNSEFDDFGIIFDKTGTRGYFSSNRNGKRSKDDIFSFRAERDLIPHLKNRQIIKLLVQDEMSLKRLKGAAIYLEKLDDNGIVANKEFYDTQLSTEGDEFRILMRWKNPEDFPDPMYETDINGLSEIQFTYNEPLALIVTLDGYRVYQEPLKVGSDGEVVVKLQYIECKTLHLETRDDNNNKIQPSVKIINDCNKDEYKLSEQSFGHYEVCLQPDCYYTVITSLENFKNDTLIILSESIEENESKVISLISERYSSEDISLSHIKEKGIEDIEKLKTGEVITLRKIYYDFNKSSIRKGAAEELDALAIMMKKHPSMKIELNSHTDSRGSEGYNLELSLQRALSAKVYLVKKGIDTKRVVAVGYGESMLLNECSKGIECTEEQHQFNRRTEVRILSGLDADIEKVDNKPKVIDNPHDK